MSNQITKIGIHASRWREQVEDVTAMIEGCIAMVDPEDNINLHRLLSLASDHLGDIADYQGIMNGLKAINDKGAS